LAPRSLLDYRPPLPLSLPSLGNSARSRATFFQGGASDRFRSTLVALFSPTPDSRLIRTIGDRLSSRPRILLDPVQNRGGTPLTIGYPDDLLSCFSLHPRSEETSSCTISWRRHPFGCSGFGRCPMDLLPFWTPATSLTGRSRRPVQHTTRPSFLLPHSSPAAGGHRQRVCSPIGRFGIFSRFSPVVSSSR